MTAPMTTEKLEEIRKCYAEEQAELEAQPRYEPTIEWKEDAVRDLLAEVDRLRALPVLRTCGECRDIWGEGSAGHVCNHERGNKGPVSPRSAPPSWCPRRGGE